jgi:hypothetical protein
VAALDGKPSHKQILRLLKQRWRTERVYDFGGGQAEIHRVAVLRSTSTA